MEEWKASCPHCAQRIAIPSDWLNQDVACPACEKSFRVAADSAGRPTAPAAAPCASRALQGQGVLIAALVTLVASVVAMVSLSTTGTVLYSVPIFALAAILAFVAMGQGYGAAGVLVVAASIGLPLLWHTAVIAPATRMESAGDTAERVSSWFDGLGERRRTVLAATESARNEALGHVEVFAIEAKIFRSARRRVPGIRFALRNTGPHSFRSVAVTVCVRRPDGTLLTEQTFHPLEAGTAGSRILEGGKIWVMESGTFLPFEHPLTASDLATAQITARVTGGILVK